MYCTKLMYFLYLLGVNKCYGYGYGYGYGYVTVVLQGEGSAILSIALLGHFRRAIFRRHVGSINQQVARA